MHARAVVPDEYFVPLRTVAIGEFAAVLAAGSDEVSDALRGADFADVAVRVHEFGAHTDDELVDPRSWSGGDSG